MKIYGKNSENKTVTNFVQYSSIVGTVLQQTYI